MRLYAALFSLVGVGYTHTYVSDLSDAKIDITCSVYFFPKQAFKCGWTSKLSPGVVYWELNF